MSVPSNHAASHAFAALLLACALPTCIQAAPISRNLAPNTAGYVSSFNYSSVDGTSPGFAVTGWSNRVTGNQAIAQDQIARWQDEGIGVENANLPQQMVDNRDGDYDALLFSFDRAVKVTRLGFGAFSTDADVSLLAYTGTTPFPGNLLGFGSDWSALLNNGWSVVGNYNRNGVGEFDVNPSAQSSQFGLVSAYNNAFGGSLSQRNDAFLLNNITVDATPTQVPEPGSWMLVATALAGLAGACGGRRRPGSTPKQGRASNA